ncbi:CmpA/NrtA family ABC transporter substrate-binding protein [Calothrix sp. NIES-3974]|uniref:CmpA/NrtA family ABC transporter substrate-binding protein n=1 Tax=Calothrix sp. NIES-3974 TaxID=2005462 RepID=UPI000B615A04|nr:CmpA/NrtA family ABC transporter substrate-binding protein [Calothrix sp. NIES-3974]BAZ04094.1 twin-arginine translocation pathway signal [Calothrix sp. NIES-3974]
MAQLSRRKFLTTTGATVLIHQVQGCSNFSPVTRAELQHGVYAGNGNTPETTSATLGFVPVMSASPLIIAQAKGFFSKYGMTDIKVQKQPSWAVMRDKLMLGAADDGLDGGHLLFPMAYLIATGEISYGRKIPLYILARMNVNGQGISVAKEYLGLNLGLDGSSIKAALQTKAKGGNSIRFAIPFRRVTGDFFMRWWLEYAGINPDRDASLIVIPPPQMVANMRGGTMEGFCVVDPWHQRLINQKIGYSAVTSGELWSNHPEKALVVRAEWVDKYPRAAKALLAGLMEAQIWCDKPENKPELIEILSQRQWIGLKPDLMRDRMMGKFDYGNGRVVENSPHAIKFWSYPKSNQSQFPENKSSKNQLFESVSYPYKSHDLWFLIEDMRWGYRHKDFPTQKLINQVNREDIWRETATMIGQEQIIPTSTSRGIEKFFNGLEFNPDAPEKYLNSTVIK